MTTRSPTTAHHDPLTTLVEIVPMPLAFFDRDYRFVYANAAAATQVQVPREELVGKELAEVLPLAWPSLKKLLDRALCGEIVSDLEVDLSEISDQPYAWIGSFYPVREGDEVTAVACTSYDVSTLRSVQRELRIRNDLYAMLARVNAAVSRSVSKEDLFKEICEIAVETGKFEFAWVGVEKNGAIVPVAAGGPDDRYRDALESSDLIISTDPDDERSKCQTGQAYMHGTTSFLNHYLESPDTKQWHAVARGLNLKSAAALPIREHDRVVAVLTVYASSTDFFNDELSQTLSEITESTSHALDRIDLESRQQQVQQAQKMEAIGQLAGGIAHDFNNALTAIRSYADLALTDGRNGSLEGDLKQIGVAAEHATELTRQLLAFSRQQVLQPKSTDLNNVVRETTALLARVIGDGVTVAEELDPQLDAVLIDRGQMQQVILNLCINARDAMTSGGTITIRTSPCDLDQSDAANGSVPKAGRYAKLTISDTGSGMDETTRSKVFEPFFTTKSEGTGLGLATVYGIVRQSGGHIEIASELGVGTTFTILLPTTTAEVEREPTRSDVASDSLDGTETILHVEDSEMLRPLIARALGRRGYTVLSAADANEALELAHARPGSIDLVLTDITLPGMNGREMAKQILEEQPEIKVLYTSGYCADVVLKDGLAAEGFNFIEKPFASNELIQLIRSILDGGRLPKTDESLQSRKESTASPG